MKVIGITGGIGAGKSRVLDYMREKYAAAVCQTDKAAHELQKPGKDCYREIVRNFGAEILNADGSINRKVLGSIVFSAPKKLELLNGIVHPAVKAFVKEEMKRSEEAGADIFVIESALLMEDHYEEICDRLWYIYADKSVRTTRLKESRELEDEKIENIMHSQADEEAFRSYCDVTIDNSGTFACTEKQIEKALGGR